MSKPQVQTVRGFRDFLPEEAQKRQWLKNKITEVFELWGYDPLETPTVEALEIFAGQIGEDEKLFFKFQDPGGRDVALRYDQTVPACRVVGQYFQELPTPFKRYQIQPAFRAEKPQKGRYREFLQCDADIFGIKSPLADAEVVALSLDVYRKIGFPKAVALINDRALLRELPYEAIVAIDKIKKIGDEGVIKDMESKGITNTKANEYLTYVKNLKPNETIQTILDYLEACGFDRDWYQFDPTIARSFSYSSGPIWEIEIPGFTAGSVLGGERFDNLVEQISGRDVPGTGFAIGFDRTLEAALEFGLLPTFKTAAKVLITIFDKTMTTKSITVASQLRAAGINTEVYPGDTEKVSKQMNYANKKGLPFVIFIGEEELKQNKLTLKNMQTGDQEMLSLKAVIEKLS